MTQEYFESLLPGEFETLFENKLAEAKNLRNLLREQKHWWTEYRLKAINDDIEIMRQIKIKRILGK